MLQETAETELRNRSTTAHFPIDPTFRGMSYSERYQEMVSRFVGENIYQSGWFLTTEVTAEGVVYNEPLATGTAVTFRAQIHGRVDYVNAVLASVDH